MIKQAYINGFMRKCAEYGIDGRNLVKIAAVTEWKTPLEEQNATSTAQNSSPYSKDAIVSGVFPFQIAPYSASGAAAASRVWSSAARGGANFFERNGSKLFEFLERQAIKGYNMAPKGSRIQNALARLHKFLGRTGYHLDPYGAFARVDARKGKLLSSIAK